MEAYAYWRVEPWGDHEPMWMLAQLLAAYAQVHCREGDTPPSAADIMPGNFKARTTAGAPQSRKVMMAIAAQMENESKRLTKLRREKAVGGSAAEREEVRRMRRKARQKKRTISPEVARRMAEMRAKEKGDG